MYVCMCEWECGWVWDNICDDTYWDKWTLLYSIGFVCPLSTKYLFFICINSFLYIPSKNRCLVPICMYDLVILLVGFLSLFSSDCVGTCLCIIIFVGQRCKYIKNWKHYWAHHFVPNVLKAHTDPEWRTISVEKYICIKYNFHGKGKITTKERKH